MCVWRRREAAAAALRCYLVVVDMVMVAGNWVGLGVSLVSGNEQERESMERCKWESSRSSLSLSLSVLLSCDAADDHSLCHSRGGVSWHESYSPNLRTLPIHATIERCTL